VRYYSSAVVAESYYLENRKKERKKERKRYRRVASDEVNGADGTGTAEREKEKESEGITARKRERISKDPAGARSGPRA